jgi:hypothetical protein
MSRNIEGTFICQYVHTILIEAHILLAQEGIPHINLDELYEMKIPALRGRAKTSNLLILETIALSGPLLKYGVWKKLEKRGIPEYSTITRRIDSLKKKGYLAEAGKRSTQRGKQKAESVYGLTWKGFIASFINEKVRKDFIQVIERNPLLVFPEKEFALIVVKEVFSTEELEKIVNLLIYGCLRVIPNLEGVKEEELAIWILHGLREIPPDLIKINMPEKTKDLTRLLDNPKILEFVRERIVPTIAEWARNFFVLSNLFRLLNEVGEFISRLDPKDKPSEKLKEYLKTVNLEEKMHELEKQRLPPEAPM